MFNLIISKIKELINFLNSSEDDLIYLDNRLIQLETEKFLIFMGLSLEEKEFFLDNL